MIEIHTSSVVSCAQNMLLALFVSCGLLYAAPVQSDMYEPRALFDEALRANANFENERLQKIVSERPEVLLARNSGGISLIEFAFYYLNEDVVSQTNFEFLTFLINHDFFGQKVNRAEHFSFAVRALRGADNQINRIDLSSDMIVHSSREPFIGLLSQTIVDRAERDPLSSEESLGLVLQVCDPEVFEAGQGKFFGTQFVQAVASALIKEHSSFIEVYLQTGTLDAICVEELLG